MEIRSRDHLNSEEAFYYPSSGAKSGILLLLQKSSISFVILHHLPTSVMTKMVTRSSPNKGPDLDSPLKSQNLLKNPSSELCRFTDPEIDQFYTRFPPNIVLRAFDYSAKGDCVSSTWVCFPAAPFQTGYSYLSLSSLSASSH
ncbi:hypothetical protein Hanom_Chr02g00104221 [Helianthus anomalus]